MAFQVLIAIPWFAARGGENLDRLRAAGCEIVTNQEGRTLTEDGMIAAVAGCHATIAGGEPYSERVLAAATDLKVVARLGVGYDMIDLPAATRHGVAIAMAFGTNHEAVADQAFALMAGLANRVLPYHRKVMDGGWGGDFHRSLWRATVGIVGLGRIGRALARRCQGFEMRVLAYDVQPDPAYAQQHGIELVSLEQLLAESDFVSIHAPRSPDSDHLISRERLALMKPSAYLVNTARGGLVDEAALYEALAANRIAGAGLDVFETEPLPADSPLRQLPNVVFSPHCAGGSIDAVHAMFECCVDNILAIKDGRNPGADYVLNPEVL